MATAVMECTEKDVFMFADKCRFNSEEDRFVSFEKSLHQAMAIVEDIKKNGVAGHRTLDDLLNED